MHKTAQQIAYEILVKLAAEAYPPAPPAPPPQNTVNHQTGQSVQGGNVFTPNAVAPQSSMQQQNNEGAYYGALQAQSTAARNRNAGTGTSGGQAPWDNAVDKLRDAARQPNAGSAAPPQATNPTGTNTPLPTSRTERMNMGIG